MTDPVKFLWDVDRQLRDQWRDLYERCRSERDEARAEREQLRLMRRRVRAFLEALSRTPMPVALLEERKALLEALGE